MNHCCSDGFTDVNLIFKHQADFRAGQLKEFSNSWREITSDSNILQYVHGVKLEFKDDILPSQHGCRPSVFNALQHDIVDSEIQTLLY